MFTTSGTFMLLFIAALQNIGGEIQEAAMVDGANGWQRFWRVTLPQLRPTLFTVITLGLIGCWQVFDEGSNWPWTDGIRHIIECIETGTAPVIAPEHAYHVLEIMLASMASGDSGQAIPIESTFTPPRFDGASTLGPGAHLIHDPGADA